MQDLAAQVEFAASALHRVLRVLSSHGIFSEVAPGAFVSTALFDGLRTDAPSRCVTWRCSRTRTPTSRRARCCGRCRPGSRPAETVFGTSFFHHLARDLERNAVFNRGIGGGAAARAVAAAAYDWSGASVVARIGGGNGSVLVGVLRATSTSAVSCSTSPTSWPRRSRSSRRPD